MKELDLVSGEYVCRSNEPVEHSYGLSTVTLSMMGGEGPRDYWVKINGSETGLRVGHKYRIQVFIEEIPPP